MKTRSVPGGTEKWLDDLNKRDKKISFALVNVATCNLPPLPLSFVKEKSSREDADMKLGMVEKKKIPAFGVFIFLPAVNSVIV